MIGGRGIADLREFFEKNVYARGSVPDSEWVIYLDKFFKFIVGRRIKRVEEWFKKNLIRFSIEHNEIIITNSALEREINRLNSFWNICRLSCVKCGLSCLKTSRHDDNPQDASHDCQTNHNCKHECEFKEDHFDGIIPICEHFAAHQGKHKCSFSHACNAPCIHAGKKNCQKGLCAKDIGHENIKGNETHKCNSNMHYCGEPCSLNVETAKDNYECKNECMVPCEMEHDVHKCQKDVCPITCPIKNCQRQCDNKNHFHALEENAIHFCGGEHDCQEDCEVDGICKIVTEPTAIIQEEIEYENIKNSRKSTPVGQMTTAIFENRRLSHPDELLQEMMKYFAEGGTDFAEGIKCASNLIKKHHDPLKVNLVIFLSDGLGILPENELRELCQLETNLGIYLYTIKFTRSSMVDDILNIIPWSTKPSNPLEQMVKIANKYLPKCYDDNSLKGKYILAIDEIELAKHFMHVSESLRDHKSTLMRK
ncbi:e3 ubiquitin-protein ligase trip12 [Gigaspora margarita]|uniref:E3 ubiquitin-protein ligase trip12 n=1 Tax=Gigaspora margarita TaxID=4874 RepID=A0A8H3X7P2_GIGMA|nr:e3 ubiquitin-protein ligase trip12 [Gigaspora margarita]